MIIRNVLLVLLLGLISQNALCETLEEVVDFLRHEYADTLRPITRGEICERLAVQELRKFYPEPKFAIEGGILYGRKFNKSAGELDAVVFEKSTRIARLVAEVKCTRDLERERNSAKEQLRKFQRSVEGRNNLWFHLASDSSVTFRKSQFQYPLSFILISQRGGVEAGFDMELNYSLNELEFILDKIGTDFSRP